MKSCFNFLFCFFFLLDVLCGPLDMCSEVSKVQIIFIVICTLQIQVFPHNESLLCCPDLKMAPLKGVKTKYKNKQLTTTMSHKAIVAFIVEPRPHQTETPDERKNSKLLKTLLWIRSLQQSKTLTVIILIFCCCLFFANLLNQKLQKPASRKNKIIIIIINKKINIFPFFFPTDRL